MSVLGQNQQAKDEEVYFNFINSIKSEVTKKVYEDGIRLYLKFCNLSKVSELLMIADPQKQIIEYIMSLRNKGLSSNTISTWLLGIYHLYEMNDVSLNKKKMNMFNYSLNVNLDICLKIYTKVIRKIPNIDARISPDDINPDTSIVNLFFTRPGNRIPFIKINITTAEVQLDKYHFSVSIIGTLDETENQNVRFFDILIDRIMSDYGDLKPYIKEGIVHTVTQGLSNRVASRSIEVKYRMFDRMYEEDEDYGYDIDENEIAETVLLHIISMEDIYSRIYQTN